MEERQKNQSLEIALLEYQNELKESYKIIIELRYHIKKLDFLIQTLNNIHMIFSLQERFARITIF